jgi:peroxiredoxin
MLAVLAVVGFILIARTAFRDAVSAGAQAGVAQATGPRANQVAFPSGSLQEMLALRDVIPTHRHSLARQRAPDFELADYDGKVWNLRELQDGQPLVLIFYYGCHCVHCAQQLYDVNRDLPLFREIEARVVAISGDAPELTRRWIEQYGPFGFPVLSDPGNKVALAYQSYKWAPDGKMPDMLRHGTFVIDRNGTVQWVNVSDSPFRRNSALLWQLAQTEGSLASALETFPSGR